MADQRKSSGNMTDDKHKSSEESKKSGQHSGGGFKNNPEKASEAGKKGGKSSNSGRQS